MWLNPLRGTISFGHHAMREAEVKAHYVQGVIGRFVLVRKGNDTCALRFTDAKRGHDATIRTIFNSGDESIWAPYELYEQRDGSGDLQRGNVTYQQETAAYRGMVGLGHMSIPLGNLGITCGDVTLPWDYPTALGFHSYGQNQQKGYGVEIAPTAWDRIDLVNVQDPALVWYRAQWNRIPLRLQINELPGGAQKAQ